MVQGESVKKLSVKIDTESLMASNNLILLNIHIKLISTCLTTLKDLQVWDNTVLLPQGKSNPFSIVCKTLLRLLVACSCIENGRVSCFLQGHFPLVLSSLHTATFMKT